MSGHSHAKTVKRAKDANDQQRSKIFSKLARLISIAAKEGPNPDFNPKLKQAIDEAKKANMPKDNIERAIKRGSGELNDGQILEEIFIEALGPSGSAFIIEGITDNKNRTMSEIKQILNKHNAKLAQEGSIKWQFEKRGIIIVNLKSQNSKLKNKEELELTAIEAGAEDIEWYSEQDGEFLEVRTKPENLEQTKQNLIKAGAEIESASLAWLAKNEIALSDSEQTACQKLIEELDENEATQNIFSNLAN
ncbi:MAG: YebC/PmpR family DNA-binding transcriptional regulator [Patescibacteria group bacterium]|nr:YebC/PmpR family DNA-binding transcriptional regulator [Patescibacteria group bacterium]